MRQTFEVKNYIPIVLALVLLAFGIIGRFGLIHQNYVTGLLGVISVLGLFMLCIMLPVLILISIATSLTMNWPVAKQMWINSVGVFLLVYALTVILAPMLSV